MTAFAGLPHGHAHVSHTQLPSMQPPYPSQATDSNSCAPSLRAAVQALQSEAVIKRLCLTKLCCFAD